jgi:hypothetical protein
MNLRELFNLIEMIPEAGVSYIATRLTGAGALTNDEKRMLTQWITKMEKADRSQTIKDILLMLNYENIKWISNPSEQECLKAIYENPNYIEFIEDPNEEIQLAAIMQPNVNIASIFNKIADPFPSIWIVAIKNDPDRILSMDRPHEMFQIAALEVKPGLISKMLTNGTWSKKASRVAFELDPNMFPYLENPSEEECWKALQTNPAFITRIKNPSEEMQSYAVIVS